MSTDMDMHPDWKIENERLNAITRYIADRIAAKMGMAAAYKREMRRINKGMWDDVGALSGHNDMDSVVAFMQEVNFLKQNAAIASKNDKELRMMERQLDSPYFGRIDFEEYKEDIDGEVADVKDAGSNGGVGGSANDGDISKHYIGVYGLRKPGTSEILIYDWRAPLSSMFYDFEPGLASYMSPSGVIRGEMTLKRQYRIENTRMALMFDSSLAVQDDMLQDILGKSADNRMKTIVRTIQRDQNKAIRFEAKRVLAVQGPAGSGKTSIALHRAAYLLYKHRGQLSAGDIRLFTPNGLFARYISSILPELGEEDIPTNTLTGLVKAITGGIFRKYETYAEMMERQLLNRRPGTKGAKRLETAIFKASERFAALVDDFVRIFEDEIVCFDDISFEEKVFASKGELTDLFHDVFKHMPVAKRLSRMELVISPRVAEYEKTRREQKLMDLVADPDEKYVDANEIKAKSRHIVSEELAPVRRKISSTLTIDIVDVYIKFLRRTGFTDTMADFRSGVIRYEDQIPVIYLMSLLGMMDPDNAAKQVIIDEAQDYPAIAYRFLSRYYPGSGITLLGDMNQSTNPASGINNLKKAGDLLDPGSHEYIELDKSYRSTVEIMEFASRLVETDARSFGRHGNPPKISTSHDLQGICSLIDVFIKQSKDEQYISIAVICRTVNSCLQVYSNLKSKHSISLVAESEAEIPKGIVLIPSYLAKGLEFDAVAVIITSAEEYAVPDKEAQLFYMICTRALHKLHIYSVEGAGILEGLVARS